MTYNNGIDLKKTLIKKKFFSVDILIYFDGSNDGSEKFIPINWHKIAYYKSKKKYWYSEFNEKNN